MDDHGLPPRRILPRPVPLPTAGSRHAAGLAGTAAAPPPVDHPAESGRHADLFPAGVHPPDPRWAQPTSVPETGRHHAVTETGRHHALVTGTATGTSAGGEAPDGDDRPVAAGGGHGEELTSTGSHRLLVTRPARRRWVPAGVGVAVAAVASAVVLSTGMATDRQTAGPDEAARTVDVVPSTTATPSATPPQVLPVIPTIDLTPGTPGIDPTTAHGDGSSPRSSPVDGPGTGTTTPGRAGATAAPKRTTSSPPAPGAPVQAPPGSPTLAVPPSTGADPGTDGSTVPPTGGGTGPPGPDSSTSTSSATTSTPSSSAPTSSSAPSGGTPTPTLPASTPPT